MRRALRLYFEGLGLAVTATASLGGLALDVAFGKPDGPLHEHPEYLDFEPPPAACFEQAIRHDATHRRGGCRA